MIHTRNKNLLAAMMAFFSLLLDQGRGMAASEPSTMVTVADYQIGQEGLPDASQVRAAARQAPSRLAARPGVVQRKRLLVSLHGGETGESIPARGYLTDVVWGEQTSFPPEKAGAEPVRQERILYYSFNVGQWQRRLDSETSVLTRAFMTQPMLIFLTDDDKVKIAAQLAPTPLFAQAIAEHKNQVVNPLASGSLLNDLVAALGEQGVGQLTEAQRQRSGQAFRSRLAAQKASLMPSEVAATATPGTGIDFTNNSMSYNVFPGLDVNGGKALGSAQFDFSSYSTLYYGIQQQTNFENVTGTFWQGLDRHFFKVPLLEPVKGWIDPNLRFGETSVAVRTVSPALAPSDYTTAKSVNVVIFRNNPNTILDAPAAMNLMTAGAIMVEAAVGPTIAALVGPAKLESWLDRMETVNSNAVKYTNAIALSYTVVKSVLDLVCTGAQAKDGVCGDYLDKIETLVSLMPTGVISSMENGLKTQAIGSLNSDIYCGTAVVQTVDRFFSPKMRKTALADNAPKTQLALCAFDQIFTKPFLGAIQLHLPDEYRKIQAKQYDTKSIRLTADFFKRKGWNIVLGTVPPADFRLETLMAKLIRVGIAKGGVADTLRLSATAMDYGAETTKFFGAVASGKVELMPFFRQLVDALVESLISNGKQYIADAIYDVFKALTPAKYVQMASVVGNQGTALVWDWMTDPSVVKLAMKRTSANTLSISTAIPKMQGVRFLQVPTADDKILSDSLQPSMASTDGQSILYPVANTPETNHLLVYSGFQASVENQSAFLKDRGTSISSLLANKRITMMWHVKRFASSAAMAIIPWSQRTEANAFVNSNTHLPNCFDEIVLNTWFPWNDPIVNLDSGNPLHAKIFKDANGVSTLGNYSAIDFTRIYSHLIGDNPLTHITPGIYSDYTHIRINSGTDEKLFQNTFQVYVLPDLNSETTRYDTRLNNRTLLYCEGNDTLCTQGGELQMNFTGDWLRDDVGRNGLWVVWRTKGVYSEPIALGSITGGGETRTLRLPANATAANTHLLLYEDVMHGYIQHSGKSRTEVLIKAFADRVVDTGSQRRYPIIALPLKTLTRTPVALLKPQDTDHDGMPDEWETRYGLNPAVNDAAQDLDQDGLSNLDEYTEGFDPTDPNTKPRVLDPGLLTVVRTDGDGSYPVTWFASATGAVTYILQEATNSTFTAGVRRAYTGPNPNTTINGRVAGTYYYRVKATKLGYTASDWRKGANGCLVEGEATPAQFTNTLGMAFNLLPAGTFTMGSPASEPGRDSDEAQHQVTLSQGFYMQTTEVTQGQWRAVMGTSPSWFSSCGENCPVEQVSWDDIQTFIIKLNQRGEGSYRLPTEAEWEYAARAGSTTAIANGEVPDPWGRNNPDLDLIGWYEYNSGGTTHPVAGKQANDWGLYDMHGNVWEWMQDWYGSYSGAVTDPQGPAAGSDRVFRGGYWTRDAGNCRSAARSGRTPDSRISVIGFRLMRTP